MTKTTFETLNAIDVSQKIEKKMGLSYLSWAWAWAEMKKVDENATVEIHEFADGFTIRQLAMSGCQITREIIEATKINYRQDEAGAYVTVSVTIKGRTETESLPVMDMKNKAVKEPDAMQINKAHKRCFVKALALHGLGLFIFAGEDIPEAETEKKKEENDLREQTLAIYNQIKAFQSDWTNKDINEQVALFADNDIAKMTPIQIKIAAENVLKGLTDNEGKANKIK